jgi:hypothetical protein
MAGSYQTEEEIINIIEQTILDETGLKYTAMVFGDEMITDSRSLVSIRVTVSNRDNINIPIPQKDSDKVKKALFNIFNNSCDRIKYKGSQLNTGDTGETRIFLLEAFHNPNIPTTID